MQLDRSALRIRALGDRALLVEVAGATGDAIRQGVHSLFARLMACPPEGASDIVAGVASVAVHYSPARVPRAGDELPCRAMEAAIADLLDEQIEPALPALPAPQTFEIPVCYDASLAPDLAEVAAHAGMTAIQVVDLHAQGEYTVQMIGFLPGFPYLAGLHPRLTTPRRATPRSRVPAGSVGIGGAQTGIYPLESPGGWQLIGRTSVPLFDARRNPPTLLRLGDRVVFRAVSLDEFTADRRDR